MDFAAVMAAQIAKAQADSASSGKKYAKNSEVEAQRLAAYAAEQRALEEAREAKAAAKRKREDEVALETKLRDQKRSRLAEETRQRRELKEREEERARRKRLGLPELLPSQEGTPAAGTEDDDDDDDDGDDALSNEQVCAGLRALGKPATLFGETDAQRRRRHRQLTAGPAAAAGPIATTLRPVEEKNMKVAEKVPADRAGRKYVYRQLASYFNMVLREWELAMEREKRDTLTSRTAYNAMVQSKEAMKPVSRAARPLCSPTRGQLPSPSLCADDGLPAAHSCSASSKRETWTTASSTRWWRSCGRRRSGGTWTPTTATCA